MPQPHHRRVGARLTLGVLAMVVPIVMLACSSSDDSGETAAPPADGTVPGCQGSYEGTMDGAVAGSVTGSLDASGSLQVSMTPTGATAGAGTTTVQAGSELVFAVGAYAVRGTFDLTTCTVTGTWAEGFGRGTWTLSRVGG